MTQLYYTNTHEWFYMDGTGLVHIGLTNYAVEQLTEVTYIDPEMDGTMVRAGSAIADVESVKTVDAVFTPCDGIVRQFNSEWEEVLKGDTEDVNSWLVTVQADAGFKPEDCGFMNKAQYENYIAMA